MRKSLIGLGLLACILLAHPSISLAQATGQQTGGVSTGQQTGGTATGQQTGGVATGQQAGGCAGGTLCNPLNVTSLEGLMTAILGAIVKLATILLTLMLVYTGFLFVMAQGNEEKLTNAKNTLVWTVIGGLILLGATAIQAVITATVAGFHS